MNIVVIFPNYSKTKYGGTYTYVKYFCNTMSKIGHRIFVLSTSYTEDDAEDENELLSIIHTNVSNNFLIRYIQRVLFFGKEIKKLNEKYGVDYINIHSGHWLEFLKLHPSLKQIPVFYTFHASRSYEIYYDEKRKRFGKLQLINKAVSSIEFAIRYTQYRINENKWLNRSKKVVVLSNYVKSQIRHFYPTVNIDKVNVISGGISIENVTDIDKSKAREMLNLPSDLIIFFTLRRMIPRMGIDNLLRAIHNFKNRKNWILLLGSDGIMKEELQQLAENLGISEQTKFLGYIPDEKVSFYYKAVDAFILPTEQLEGFGLVTLESFANGTPVIATNAGANKELISNFNNNLIANGTSVKAIFEKLEYYFDHRDEIHAINYTKIAEKFQWTSICKEIEKCLLN